MFFRLMTANTIIHKLGVFVFTYSACATRFNCTISRVFHILYDVSLAGTVATEPACWPRQVTLNTVLLDEELGFICAIDWMIQ